MISHASYWSAWYKILNQILYESNPWYSMRLSDISLCVPKSTSCTGTTAFCPRFYFIVLLWLMFTAVFRRGVFAVRSTPSAALSTSIKSMAGPIQTSIETKLVSEFPVKHLQVINESHMHNVPKNSETHFKVVIVSDIFEGVPLLQRHRMVNSVLEHELGNGVHALSIQSKTPAQWTKSGGVVSESPLCLGGMARERREKDKNNH